MEFQVEQLNGSFHEGRERSSDIHGTDSHHLLFLIAHSLPLLILLCILEMILLSERVLHLRVLIAWPTVYLVNISSSILYMMHPPGWLNTNSFPIIYE